MTTLKAPYEKSQQIKTEDLIRIGNRLREIRDEIGDMTLMYAVHTEYNPFSKSIEELRDDIIRTLGNRSLDNIPQKESTKE